MKIQQRFTMTALAIGLCISHNTLLAKDMNHKDNQKQYKEVTVLDKGIKRTLFIEGETSVETSKKNQLSVYNTKAKDVKKGLLLRMKKGTTLNIIKFETTYGLKFKEKLTIGYYVFKNISEKSDMEIVNLILTNEKNIDTVKPNWSKKKMPR